MDESKKELRRFNKLAWERGKGGKFKLFNLWIKL
jgi:hypothetical protein